MRDRYGWTALMWSTQNSDWEMTRVLVSRGANTKFRDKDGDTPLMNAVLHPQYDRADLRIVRLLLANGADPLTLNRKGFSPLSVAHRPPVQESLVRVLLKRRQLKSTARP